MNLPDDAAAMIARIDERTKLLADQSEKHWEETRRSLQNLSDKIEQDTVSRREFDVYKAHVENELKDANAVKRWIVIGLRAFMGALLGGAGLGAWSVFKDGGAP